MQATTIRFSKYWLDTVTEQVETTIYRQYTSNIQAIYKQYMCWSHRERLEISSNQAMGVRVADKTIALDMSRTC